ncbi:hypothetical protein H2248_006771 [Termitomyces sp. 'cryptogamus']|nr:hypothetical protein H2248_009271 [Termitomyces sp. 'cryptogamus']KAH0588039.1 hypothetical protein H2248_006771 [Termitomyces sp. 'cryptogamus']
MRAEAVLSSTPPCQEQAILHHAVHKAVNVPHSLLLELCVHAVIQSLSMDFLFSFVGNLIMNSVPHLLTLSILNHYALIARHHILHIF